MQAYTETESRGVGSGSSRTGGRHVRAAWARVLLRLAALASSFLCIAFPIAWLVFEYPLYHKAYLRVYDAGEITSNYTWRQPWLASLDASLLASFLFGVVAMVLAIVVVRQARETGGESNKGRSKLASTWPWVFTAAIVCVIVGLLGMDQAIDEGRALVVVGIVLFAALAASTLQTTGRTGNGSWKVLLALCITAFVFGLLADADAFLAYFLMGAIN